MVGVSYGARHKLGPYLEALRAADLEFVTISTEEARTLVGLDGLLLTGGSDIDPDLYGQKPSGAEDVKRKRDELETQLISEAYARDLPVLAICRGLQMLNVARGGTLHQHLEGHRGTEHSVCVTDGCLLGAMVGEGEYSVNSRHHQAADRIGEGLLVTATAPDGIVEGLEDPGRLFVVAVQWHPEDRIGVPGSRDLRIFKAFAKAVRRRA